MRKKYLVMWPYRSSLGSLEVGKVVELDERTAEMMNVDSPGVLVEVDERRNERGKRDRMERGKGKRRS